MILRIYNFILVLSASIAGLLIVAGGICIVLGGASPGLYDKGRTMLWGAFWGIVLIISSWVIVNVVFLALGYGVAWQLFPNFG